MLSGKKKKLLLWKINVSRCSNLQYDVHSCRNVTGGWNIDAMRATVDCFNIFIVLFASPSSHRSWYLQRQKLWSLGLLASEVLFTWLFLLPPADHAAVPSQHRGLLFSILENSYLLHILTSLEDFWQGINTLFLTWLNLLPLCSTCNRERKL